MSQVVVGVREVEGGLRAGDRVVLDAGVLLDGYEGGLARTIVCGDSQPEVTPADDLFARPPGGRAGTRIHRRPAPAPVG